MQDKWDDYKNRSARDNVRDVGATDKTEPDTQNRIREATVTDNSDDD